MNTPPCWVTIYRGLHYWAIPPETTHFLAKKKSWSSIIFSVKYTSIGLLRVHYLKYQPPVTYGDIWMYKFRQLGKNRQTSIGHNFFVNQSFFNFYFRGCHYSTSSYKKVIWLHLTLISNFALYQFLRKR